MIALRRLFALGLGLHGVVHTIGFAVAWKLSQPKDFAYSTEVAGGIDIGTVGTRILGVMWLAAGAAFVVAAVNVLQRRSTTLSAIVTAATLSSLVCLMQVDVAWRGVAINIALLFGITVWGLMHMNHTDKSGVTP
jgi:hypothetical protein